MKNQKEKIDPVGIIRIKKYRAGTLGLASPYAAQLMRYRNLARFETSRVMRLFYKHREKSILAKLNKVLELGYIGTALEQKNLIMQGSLTGKDLFIQFLLGTASSFIGGINYGALGTSSTPAAVGDTQLGTEVARTVVSFSQDSGYNEAVIQFFFPDSTLANNTYTECGTFFNGTASANSGNIFNHAIFGTSYVKTSGVDTTLEVDITLT